MDYGVKRGRIFRDVVRIVLVVVVVLMFGKSLTKPLFFVVTFGELKIKLFKIEMSKGASWTDKGRREALFY